MSDAVSPFSIDPARQNRSTAGLFSALVTLVDRLERQATTDAGVIQWGCPVPTFGDLARSKVATLGLNPSNREFVDERGLELHGDQRRFETLRSLDISSWSDAEVRHLSKILDSCRDYFRSNPYDRWFKRLDLVVSGTGSSFYDLERPACHLDIVPYATEQKWTALTTRQRTTLLELSGDALGLLLRQASLRVLILNGQAVVSHFLNVAEVTLTSREMRGWSLPRRSGDNILGIAYHGVVDTVSGHRLTNELLVLGYNHNLQSSYGVTSAAIRSIGHWIAEAAGDMLS